MGKKLKQAVDTFSEEEKQLAFLLKLSDAIRLLDNPVDIEEAVTKIAMDFLDADRCYYCTIEEGNAIILRDALRGDLPSVGGVYPISSFALFKGVLDAGHPFIVDDVHTTNIIDEELKQLCVQLQNISFINVPVIKKGKPVGVLSLVHSKPRKWTDLEVQLTIETAERTWAAVERAKALETLRKSEEKYHRLFDSIDEGFSVIEVMFDGKGKAVDYIFLEMNPAHEAMSGMLREAAGKRIRELMPNIEESEIERIGKVVLTGEPVRFEQYVSASNRWFDVHLSRMGGIGSQKVASIFNNITERKLAEEKIKESESRFYELIYSSPSLMAILKGEDMIIEVANDAIIESWGKEKDIIGKSIFLVLPEVLEQDFDKLLLNVYKTGEPFHAYETPVTLLRNGINELIYYNFVYQAQRKMNGEIEGVAIIANEVTPQALLNKKIKESEERYHALFMNSPFAFSIMKGKDMKVILANDLIKELWGKGKNVEGKTLLEILPELSNQPFPAMIDSVYTSGEPVYANEMLAQLNRHGIMEDRYFNIVYEPYLEADETISGVITIAHEVTQQVLARKKIEESEKKFEAAILAVNGIIWTNNANGEMMGEQPGWANLTGQSFEEYQGYGWANAVHPDDAQPTVEAWNKAVATNSTFEFEHRLNTKQDGWRLFSVKAVPSFDENGAIQQWVGVHTDITEQREAEQKIKESEERFKSIADESPMFVFIVDPDPLAPVSYWNKTWLYYTGQTEEQAAGRAWDGIVHPGDVQVFMDIYNPAFVARQAYFVPAVRIMNVNGDYRWHSFKSNPRYLDNGEFNGYIGVGFDIHEQKLAEEKLAYRTALLEAHNEASVDGLLLVDAKGKILSFNQRFVEIWNMPPHIVNANDDEAALSFAMNQLVNPQQFITKVKYFYDHPTEACLDELEFKDGKVVERNGYAVIGVDGTYYAWSWTFKDITERKRIEQDLKNTQEQLELTFKNIPAGVYLINAKGEMVYVNDRGATVYGDFTPEYILEHKDLSTLLKIADELFERFDENGNYFSSQNSPAFISLTTGKPSQAILKQINKITREQRWYYVQGAPLFDEKGNVSQVLITSTDITEQKNAEEKIKYSEERFRSLAQTLPQLVWVTDAQGNAEFVSPRWKEYSGIEPGGEEEWKAIVHPDDFDNINATWMHCLSTGEIYTFDVRLKGKNGEYKWFRVMGEPVLDKENKIIKWVGAFTDIHSEKLFTQELELKVKERTKELKQFNIELEKKNKELESFAYISSHDLQEPLRKIQILATRIIEKESLSEIGKDNFNRMQLAAKRMQTLIDDLLVYSKANTAERIFETIDLNIIVEEVKDDLSEELKEKHATIEATELCELQIIPFQFRQLMHNLIGNALKFSIPNRIPHIQIKSEIAYGQQLNNEKLKSENKYCHITVSDNGIGFEQQYSEKIFEVFQRLHGKNEYSGTGIGLSIVKKIVENHEGIITANSELNKGTTFNIYIPVR